jgi:hypothetical protein
MTEPTLEELRQALREGRATGPQPTDEEIRQAVEGSPNRRGPSPPPGDMSPPWPYPRVDPAGPRVTPRVSPLPIQPPHPPTPISVRSRPISSPLDGMSRFAVTLFKKLGTLLAALAFTAAPLGIMYFVGPLEGGHVENLFLSLILGFAFIAIGFGCVVWLLVGFAAVFMAFYNLFVDWGDE